MGKISIALISAALLSGCVTAQDIAANDDDACQSYGAQPGSQAYFQCRMAKDQQRQANNAALVGAYLSRPQPQPYVLQIPQQHY
jgi:hypothetical protein